MSIGRVNIWKPQVVSVVEVYYTLSLSRRVSYRRYHCDYDVWTLLGTQFKPASSYSLMQFHYIIS